MQRAVLLALLLVPSIAFAQQPTQDSVPAHSPHIAGHRNVAIARTLAIVPGLGHAYAGEELRGLGVLGGVVGLSFASAVAALSNCDLLSETSSCGGGGSAALATVGVAAMFGVWGWSIYDAGSAARRTNVRLSQRSSVASLSLGLGRRPTASGHDARVLNVGVRLKLR